MKTILSLLVLVALLSAETITLEAPKKSGGKALYSILNSRKTVRDFDKKRTLSDAQISQILWAAAGRNRTEEKNRTAPSAWGNNEVELYVLLSKGAYKYDPVNHALNLVVAGDQRKSGGKQGFVKDAPMTIVLVADLDKITQTKDEVAKLNTAHIDAGYISQNIYLVAESEGLVTGARAWLDRKELTEVLKLSSSQRVIVANSIGYGK